MPPTRRQAAAVEEDAVGGISERRKPVPVVVPSLLNASRPVAVVTLIFAVKLFVPLLSKSVPAPALVQTPPVGLPVTCPLKVNPGTTFESATTPTLIVVKFLFSVVVPLKATVSRAYRRCPRWGRKPHR